MPTLVTPWMFGVAVAASLLVAGLHLLSVRTPPPLLLPTARFVPDGDARAVARQPRLNDVPLLLLRMLALWCAGAAFAGVRVGDTRASVLRLVVADAAFRSDSAWRDSVVRELTGDDVLVEPVFATGVERDAGALLVAATQRAAVLTTRHRTLTQVELTVVLPTTTRTMRGLDAWRSQWPGSVRFVRRAAEAANVPANAPTSAGVAAVRVTSPVRDDVVAAAFSASTSSAATATRGANGTVARYRVEIERADVRSEGTMTDGVNTVRVHWPRAGVPTGWRARAVVDTAGAVVANGLVLVGPLVRHAHFDAATDTGAQVIAWFGDGEPAIVERANANGGCTRTVAFEVPPGSDLLQSQAARGVRAVILAPCGGTLAGAVLTDSMHVDSTRTATPAPASAFRSTNTLVRGSDPWWLTPLLLLMAVAALAGEWWWRRGEARA